MQESGHYYTVYYTSVAVGFSEEIAYKQAVLAQMPDEVDILDATTIHGEYCALKAELNGAAYAIGGLALEVPASYYIDEKLRNMNLQRVEIETKLHALTGEKSALEQEYTRSALEDKNLSPDSVEFGLLLHRLGDAYAHAIMMDFEEKRTYPVTATGNFVQDCIINAGHGLREPMSRTDFPHVRPYTFLNYVNDLFRILKKRSTGEIRRTSFQVRKTFELILTEINPKWSTQLITQSRFSLASPEIQKRFIRMVRAAFSANFKYDMKPYTPENDEPMSLDKWRQIHSEISVDLKKLQDAIHHIKLGAIHPH